jgi:REP element-mobilizing transposase RayT
MPRQARLDMPGALHHIMIRGINKSDIFIDDEDREKFLERLGKNILKGRCSVYAWVLMNNHVHILFKSGERGISEVMRKVLSWYAQYFNHKHKRSGHLFENRYKSILCEEDRYLLALVRYIHLNPVRAGIVKDVKGLDKYSWSGHRAFIGKADYEWMDKKYVLEQFSNRKKTALKEYYKFIEERISTGYNEELTGGGLIRSAGGWSNVLSMRTRKEKAEYDERILGGSDFVSNILKDTEENELRQLKLRLKGKSIKSIMEEECKGSKVNLIELKNGSRRKKVSFVRRKIACRSVEELGLSFAEIARNLGVDTSAISKIISKCEGS